MDATAPAGAAYAVLYLASSKDTGSVYFDDATAAVVTGAFPAAARSPVHVRRRAYPSQPRL